MSSSVIEELQAELERLFELDELTSLSRDLLGFDPEALGGTATRASFAKALVDHCTKEDAVEALCDAVVTRRPDVSPAVASLRYNGPPDDVDVAAGEELGEFTVVRKLGEDRVGVSYLAKRDGTEYRLKVLRREACRDRRGLNRFLTITRFIGTIVHDGLPNGVGASVDDKGRPFVVYEYIEGQPLATRIARTGPMHINEARPILTGILRSLEALHDRRIAHGAVSLENVVVGRNRDGSVRIVLVDAGTDRLRARARVSAAGQELSSTVGSPKSVAPELIRGQPSDARSDMYSFGALAFEILTGKPPFEGDAFEMALGHLSKAPPKAGDIAPRGWVSPDVEDFLEALLAKDPTERPASAETLLDDMGTVGRASLIPQKQISEEELTERIDKLVAEPTNDEAAVGVEAAAEEGGDLERIADAFSVAADGVDGDDRDATEARKSLLFRAARIFEQARQPENALGAIQTILRLDGDDAIAASAQSRLQRELRHFDDLIEGLLARTESASSDEERARAFAEIGTLYAEDLDDREQALVALVQAYCITPTDDDFAEQIERLASADENAWAEVLGQCVQSAEEDDLAPEAKNALLMRMGRWYLERLNRSDLALTAYQAIVATDPANEPALEGMTRIYRRAQQWMELGMVLMTRADASPAPAQARDLRAEAAQILEHQLGDVGRARDLYEQILADDPGHDRSSEELSSLYERTGEFSKLAKLLERRADALSGDDRNRVLCRVADVYDLHLKDSAQAEKIYRDVLSTAPDSMDALRGLDQLYGKQGSYTSLLEILQRQIDIAVTPRQKILLLERMASIHEEEFLDHEKAALAWEQVLDMDDAHDGALSALSRHYRALDRWSDVADVYERHAKLVEDPDRQKALTLSLAHVLSDQLNQPERALLAYEQVLAYDPEHAASLEALARLRETVGDADAALEAIEALATQASNPDAAAEHWVRAARLLLDRGDKDGAIERYKLALDATPEDRAISRALRAAYVERGDVNAAVQLIDKELEITEGDQAQAKLLAEQSVLVYEHLKDEERAEKLARNAVIKDPANTDALRVLGNTAFEGERYIEAGKHLHPVVERAESLDKAQAIQAVSRYIIALTKTDHGDQASAPADTLKRLAPDDAEAMVLVSRVVFEFGAPKKAIEICEEVLEKFKDELTDSELSTVRYRYAEALRKDGRTDEALEQMQEAIDLDPSNAEPLLGIARVYEDKGDWEQAIRIKTDHLDLASGEERAKILLEIGDIASAKLKDTTRATKSYAAALEERPDDRRILTKLMQLYSEEKDWTKLVEVVLKLAEFAEEAQKAKYYSTAAIVSARQLGDLDSALRYFEMVLLEDPSNEKVIDEVINIQMERQKFEEVEALYKQKLELAEERKDGPAGIKHLVALADLYEKNLGWMEKAVEALEAANSIEADKDRGERLAQLYASDPERYMAKSVAVHTEALRRDPYRPEPYKKLRKVYTEVKQADPAWCICQALHVLNLAEPDEERFFKRMREDTPAAAQATFDEEMWLKQLRHADADALLTSLFALIQPAIIHQRAQGLDKFGLGEHDALDLHGASYPLAQTLAWAAAVMGVDTPTTYLSDEPVGLSYAHTSAPGIILGRAGQAMDIPAQASAYLAARHLTSFLPGLYVRQLISHGTGLKAWLFAAIRMMTPQFPVAAELSGPVDTNLKALQSDLDQSQKDQLARVVASLMQGGGSLDLKKWMAGVDLTADRAGLVLCNDLETAVEVIRATDDKGASVSNQERLKQLVLFSVSPDYFDIRQKLSIAIDS